jgi:hypothetical protein
MQPGLPEQPQNNLPNSPNEMPPRAPMAFQPPVTPPQPNPPGSGPNGVFPPQPGFGGQPVAQGSFNTNPMVSPPAKKSRKKLIILVAIILVILLVVSGVVFGLYLPNKPANVYKTGFSRTGKALNEMVNSATEQSKLDAFKKSDVTLDINAKYGQESFTGNLNAKFDASKVNSGLEFKTAGSGQATNITAKILAEIPQNSQYPNIYFQVTGLKALGVDSFYPGLSNYDGKWIAITADYLKSLGNVPTAEETNKKQLTAGDFSELAKAFTAPTVDYVFGSDQDKAIFQQTSFVAKEKVDDVNTYHYKVSFNEDHAKAYCKAIVDSVYSTGAYKKLPWVDENNVEKDKDNAKKDCDESDPNQKNLQYDLWIDAKYKLIYKIRETDTTKKDTYFEIGQLYKGGDDISLFFNYHSGEENMDGKLGLNTNLKTAVTSGTFSIDGGEGEGKYNVKVTLSAKPLQGNVQVEKPANSIPIDQFLQSLGYSAEDFVSSSSSSASGANTERQTDIKAIHGQVEAYYAQWGMYPSLAEINSSSWRSLNMKGLDNEVLKDPAGSSFALAAAPAKNVYSYQVSSTDNKPCDNKAIDCAVYTLTANYDGGGTFTKTQLN